MALLTLIEIDDILGEIRFFKIQKGNKCEFDDFWTKIENDSTCSDELDIIQTVMLEIADKQEIPPSRFKKLKRNKKDKIIDYEIKTPNLRVYCFIIPDTGNIVVLGGKKGTQKKDIEKLRKIKKAYINQLIK